MSVPVWRAQWQPDELQQRVLKNTQRTRFSAELNWSNAKRVDVLMFSGNSGLEGPSSWQHSTQDDKLNIGCMITYDFNTLDNCFIAYSASPHYTGTCGVSTCSLAYWVTLQISSECLTPFSPYIAYLLATYIMYVRMQPVRPRCPRYAYESTCYIDIKT